MRISLHILFPILSQHAEMAAHLWLIRARAVHAPHYDLKDLVRLDGRIEAQLDGLRVAGGEGLRLCLEQIGPAEPGTLFAAGAVALEQKRELFAELLAWAAVDGRLARPLVAALCWQGARAAEPMIAELLGSEEEAGRYIGLSAAACLRRPADGWVEKGLQDGSPLVRARALRAVGEYGRVDLWRSIHGALGDVLPACRYWAAWSACLLGQQAGVEVLWDTAVRHNLMQERAVEAISLCLSADAALAWQRDLVSKQFVRQALLCARTAPDARSLPWLFEMMDVPEHARLAGEAFTFLTGLDLAKQDLERDAPAGFEAGPNDDPTDERVAMDPDEDLPWPDPGKLKKSWHKIGAGFAAGQRYLLGQPLTTESLGEVLRSGKQRARRVAALALCRLRPGLIETRALAMQQKAVLGVPLRAKLSDSPTQHV